MSMFEMFVFIVINYQDAKNPISKAQPNASRGTPNMGKPPCLLFLSLTPSPPWSNLLGFHCPRLPLTRSP